METSTLENTAEDLIAHHLGRAGIVVAKPRVDRNGTDLLALLKVEDGARFCRIQCKGRSATKDKRNHVNVRLDYVTHGFVVFLFIENGNPTETLLYCFFAEELREHWSTGTKYFRLNIEPISFQGNLARFRVTQDRIEKLKCRIRESSLAEEMGKLIEATLVFVEDADDTVSVSATVNSSATTNKPN